MALSETLVSTSAHGNARFTRELAALHSDQAARVADAWAAARSRGPVLVGLSLTFAVAVGMVITGTVSVTTRNVGAVTFACWAVSAAQGLGLFLWKRRQFVRACAEIGLAPDAIAAAIARLERVSDDVPQSGLLTALLE